MRTRLRKAWLALLAVPVLSLGCASFLHPKDPTLDNDITQICNALATKDAAQIAEEAAKEKLSPADLLVVFKGICMLRGGNEAATLAQLRAVAAAKPE